ncbi:MAG: hypothetical protein PHH09_10715, partial [Methanoregulaceae archaeon]|nr:hypothetical protein [Methanoregulaceae archaeon]
MFIPNHAAELAASYENQRRIIRIQESVQAELCNVPESPVRDIDIPPGLSLPPLLLLLPLLFPEIMLMKPLRFEVREAGIQNGLPGQQIHISYLQAVRFKEGQELVRIRSEASLLDLPVYRMLLVLKILACPDRRSIGSDGINQPGPELLQVLGVRSRDLMNVPNSLNPGPDGLLRSGQQQIRYTRDILRSVLGVRPVCHLLS